MTRGTRSLLVDAAIVTLAASARGLLEQLQGRLHAASDLASFYIPNFTWWWTAARWQGGWNPWIFGGYPSNADPGLAPFHPLGLLYAAFPPLTAAALEGMLAPALAAVGMLVYLRAAGCGRAGSLVGGLSFGLGGFVTAHAPHPGLVRAALAVPWALAAIEALEGRLLVAGLGLSTAALLVSGHPQVMAYGLLLILAYAAWLGRPSVRGRAAALVAGVVLGAGVAAGALLPASELIALSARGLGVVDPADPWRLGARELLALVAPFTTGGSIGPLYGRAFAGFRGCGVIECTGYPGMLVWLLVLGGVPMLVRDRRGRFWIAIAFLALLGGSGAGLLPIPGVRAPARLLLWWNIALAALAALTLGAVAAQRVRTTRWWVGAAVLAAVIAASSRGGPVALRASLGAASVLTVSGLALALGLRRGGWVAGAGLLGTLAVDLIGFATSLPTSLSPGEYGGLFRTLEAIREAKRRLPPEEELLARSLVPPVLLGAAWAPMYRVQSLQGIGSLVPRTTAFLLGGDPPSWLVEMAGVSDATLAEPRSHVLDLLRCRLVVGFFPAEVDPLGAAISAAASEGGGRWQRFGTAEGPIPFQFYLNRRARPVAWFVRHVRVVAVDEALRLVRGADPAADFDPAEEALAERPIPGLETAASEVAAAADPVVLSYGEDEIRLSAAPGAARLLVTSELSYPGWKAEIDGRPAEIHTANAGFRAVVVPAGQHEVVFRYRPRLGRLGLAASAASVLALSAIAVRGRRRRAPRDFVSGRGGQ